MNYQNLPKQSVKKQSTRFYCSLVLLHEMILRRLRTMKNTGLIGGMSLEGTALPYTRRNVAAGNALDRLNSADALMRSVHFSDIITLQKAGVWECAETDLLHKVSAARISIAPARTAKLESGLAAPLH